MTKRTSPEIAVIWTPQYLQSTYWYNVPIGQQRQASFEVLPRIGKEIRVALVPSPSPWLRIHPALGKVPFRGTVTVDTTGLQAGRSYSTVLIFQFEGNEIHRESLRVITARLPDPDPNQNTVPIRPPALQAGEVRRSPWLYLGCLITILVTVILLVSVLALFGYPP